MHLKAELDLSTQALAAGMTNNISKTHYIRKHFPICFSLMAGMVWDRDLSFSFLFAQYRSHSFNSC